MSKKLLLICTIIVISMSLIVFNSFKRYEYRDYSPSGIEGEMLVVHADLIGSFSKDQPFIRGAPYYLRLSVKTKPGFYFDHAEGARLRGRSTGSIINLSDGKIFSGGAREMIVLFEEIEANYEDYVFSMEIYAREEDKLIVERAKIELTRKPAFEWRVPAIDRFNSI